MSDEISQKYDQNNFWSDIGPTKNKIVRMLEKCDSGRTSRLLVIYYLYLSNAHA